jgi:hypothetical protein
MGGSGGPGVSRSIKVDMNGRRYILREDLDLSEDEKHRGRYLRSPVEVPLTISEEVESDFNDYLASYVVLQAAKDAFNQAKERFRNSTGGKVLENAMVPQKGPLAVEEVHSPEDVESLKELVKQKIGGDHSITSTDLSVAGYSIGMVHITLDKPILLSEIVDITCGEYVWSNYDYKTNYMTFKTDKSNKLLFVKKGGREYPPFRYEDRAELPKD